MLPDLLEQIATDRPIGKVSADGAYDTRACHAAIAARGAFAFGHSFGPMAFLPSLPTRRKGMPWKEDTPGAAARNDILRTNRRLGRTIWRRWSGYHRRSPVETKKHCLRLLGERVRSRDFGRQVAGSKSAPPSSTASLPSEPRSRSAWDDSVQGKGKLVSTPICATEPLLSTV